MVAAYGRSISMPHQAADTKDLDRAGRRKEPPSLPADWRRRVGGWSPQQWGPMLWYFLVMLAMLWFWQEASHQLTTRTIAYSRFKALVAERRVSDVAIGETEITGRVLPKPLPAQPNAPATVAPNNRLGETAAPDQKEVGEEIRPLGCPR